MAVIYASNVFDAYTECMKDISLPPASRLDARDLRLMLALATAGTTAGAAATLHITQPAVSRALLSAEGKLGVRLFLRTSRGLEPTPSGQTLLQSAERLLTDLSDLEHRIRAPAAPPLRIRLVCECYTAYHWVPSTLKRLRADTPDLELVLAVEHTSDPITALEAGEIDVALVTTAHVSRRRLVQRPLFSDEVLFIVSSASDLAKRSALTRDDLRSRALLTSHLPTPDLHWFNKAVTVRGDRPLRFQHLPLTEAILDFARVDMGIAVLSEWIAAPHLQGGDLVAKRLASGPVRRPWRIVWRREFEDGALRLLAALEQSAPRVRALPVRLSKTP